MIRPIHLAAATRITSHNQLPNVLCVRTRDRAGVCMCTSTKESVGNTALKTNGMQCKNFSGSAFFRSFMHRTQASMPLNFA